MCRKRESIYTHIDIYMYTFIASGRMARPSRDGIKTAYFGDLYIFTRMHIRVYLNVYINIYIYMYMWRESIYTYTGMYVFTFTASRMMARCSKDGINAVYLRVVQHTQMNTHTHTYTHKHQIHTENTDRHTHAQPQTRAHTLTSACTRTQTYIYIYTYLYAYLYVSDRSKKNGKTK